MKIAGDGGGEPTWVCTCRRAHGLVRSALYIALELEELAQLLRAHERLRGLAALADQALKALFVQHASRGAGRHEQ